MVGTFCLRIHAEQPVHGSNPRRQSTNCSCSWNRKLNRISKPGVANPLPTKWPQGQEQRQRNVDLHLVQCAQVHPEAHPELGLQVLSRHIQDALGSGQENAPLQLEPAPAPRVRGRCEWHSEAQASGQLWPLDHKQDPAAGRLANYQRHQAGVALWDCEFPAWPRELFHAKVPRHKWDQIGHDFRAEQLSSCKILNRKTCCEKMYWSLMVYRSVN